jgi:hypothetical protein
MEICTGKKGITGNIAVTVKQRAEVKYPEKIKFGVYTVDLILTSSVQIKKKDESI